MKFVVVTIRAGGDNDQKRMNYPDLYDAKIVERHKTGPIIYNGGISRGGPIAECMLKLSDRLADIYAADPDMRILSTVEADAWIASNPQVQSQPIEQVTDVDRLTAIIAKNVAGQALSAEDLEAVDPDSDTPGIVKKTHDTAGYYGT